MPEESIDSLKKQISVLEQRLALYEKDAIKRGFYALNKIVNQQVDILNDFKIKEKMSTSSKEDPTYDRVEAIWLKLSPMLTSLNALKIELKISGKDDDDDANFIETLAETRR